MGFCAAGSIGKILKKSRVDCIRSDLPDLGCYPIRGGWTGWDVMRQIDIVTQIYCHTCRCAVKVSSMIYDNSGRAEKPHLGKQLKQRLWAGRSRVRERSGLDKHNFLQDYFKNCLLSKACSELQTPNSLPYLWMQSFCVCTLYPAHISISFNYPFI